MVSEKVIDGMETALRGLGVEAGTLTPDARRALDREGFAGVPRRCLTTEGSKN